MLNIFSYFISFICFSNSNKINVRYSLECVNLGCLDVSGMYAILNL